MISCIYKEEVGFYFALGEYPQINKHICMVRLEGLEPREAKARLLFAFIKKWGWLLFALGEYPQINKHICMVRLEGLEPPRPKALEPKSSVSTNFTTAAYATCLSLTRTSLMGNCASFKRYPRLLKIFRCHGVQTLL